jgi:hypothetical protein
MPRLRLERMHELILISEYVLMCLCLSEITSKYDGCIEGIF